MTWRQRRRPVVPTRTSGGYRRPDPHSQRDRKSCGATAEHPPPSAPRQVAAAWRRSVAQAGVTAGVENLNFSRFQKERPDVMTTASPLDPRGRSFDDARVAIGPDIAPARVEPHAVAIAPGDQAVAVVLDLVHPRRPALAALRRGRMARRNEAWRQRMRGQHGGTHMRRLLTCGPQSGRTSAPIMPQRVHTMRRQSERTGISSGSRSAFIVAL
jgi:hypothetical protein